MYPNSSLQIEGFFFFFFFFSLLGLAKSTEPKLGDCVDKYCGNHQIKYPFWLQGEQPNYCGYPAFQVTCNNNHTSPFLSSYQVVKIIYDDNSLQVIDSKFLRDCPVIHYDLNFNLTPFRIRTTNKKLFFYYNCSTPPANSYYYPTCSNGTYAHLEGNYPDDKPSNFSSDCNSSFVPVLGYKGADGGDYKRLVQEGFSLEWTEDGCPACLESKGECGYNYSTFSFMCLCSDRTHSKVCKKRGFGRKIQIGIGSAVGGILAVSILCLLWYKHKKRKRYSSSSEQLQMSSSGPIFNTQIFSYDELKEATNGFNVSNELGDGGFGTVYKGKLRDGRTVAVKHLYRNNYRRVEQFMNEVEILSCLRHQNLLTLYGCTSCNSHELLLVFELVPNGTVADHLHGARSGEHTLTWPIRMNIAIETADALTYLHSVEPQIVHRDVKTSNILLDNNFHVKVGDFGLSRFCPVDVTHVSTVPQGTPGYVDPEYHQCYQLTDKSDVYSFGVVLMELISSKPAVDMNRSSHEINLSNMAINKLQNRQLDQLVDPGLGYQSCSKIKRMIGQVAELAFSCLQPERYVRPPMREVLEVLRGIKNGPDKVESVDKDASTREDENLVKSDPFCSPDTVTDMWTSRSTSPNTSG
ncbi:LEAF RUST 10 DISEASE-RESISTANCEUS RECEPTOR-LIKE PROTEIN KINASE-like 1.2 [Typha latifolia]|uniref:LEAF RUST 10 DISEASE-RESISTANCEUS RECEPTOR-LIKE PROTEIN KINASE-like 1.2 n=1 Tax=Typha latifolia TaxID=4733 RepID=UPI003C30D75F